jgi:hypothetical protein
MGADVGPNGARRIVDRERSCGPEEIYAQAKIISLGGGAFR